MEELNRDPLVTKELYFLIAKFLSGGPLKETAKTLLKELENVEVLPRRTDWEGREHVQQYDELLHQFQDIPCNRLLEVCKRALHLAEATPTHLPAIDNKAQNATNERDNLRVRLSLLGESILRKPPEYTPYKSGHSLVRGLLSRESLSPYFPLFPKRLLSTLQLQRRSLGHLSAVYCVAFHATGRYVITGADDLLIKVWSAVDGRLLRSLRGASAEVTDLALTKDGLLLAAGCVDRIIRIWCLQTGAALSSLSSHSGTVTAVQWSNIPFSVSQQRWLASTSTDGSLALWASNGLGGYRVVRFSERIRPGPCQLVCLAWSSGGSHLAVGGADLYLRIYSLRATGPQRDLEQRAHSDVVDSVAWAHKGLRLVSGSKDGCALLWTFHAAHWRHTVLDCTATNKADKVKVTMVCWDASDRLVLTALSTGEVWGWCSTTGQLTVKLTGHSDEVYVLEAHPSLTGVLLSAGHDGQLKIWDANNGECLSTFTNHVPGQEPSAIFDARWGSEHSIAASDSLGHLLLFGLHEGSHLYNKWPNELFFDTDYRPITRDETGQVLDELTCLPPHLLPPPTLVDAEGLPHPIEQQIPIDMEQLIPPIAQTQIDRQEEIRETLYELEMRWLSRELRRRPLMISTDVRRPKVIKQKRRPTPLTHHDEPIPESSSSSSCETSDSSVNLSIAQSIHSHSGSSGSRSRKKVDESHSSDSSSWSSCSRPKRVNRPRRAIKKKNNRKFSPSPSPPPRLEENNQTIEHNQSENNTTATHLTSRTSDWLSMVSPRKSPYFPQVGDECLYFRAGHQKYLEAVSEKDVYRVSGRDKIWERLPIQECEIMRIESIRYRVLNSCRVATLTVAIQRGENEEINVSIKYHDMPDVIDFIVLKRHFDIAIERNWQAGQSFRCLIDEHWWSGSILECSQSSIISSHYLSLKVRWDNSEMERLSPWDIEPIDPQRMPSSMGGAVPAISSELLNMFRGDCEFDTIQVDAIVEHLEQVMSLSVAEPFSYPIEQPEVPYPIDLSTIRARFQNMFYRRECSAQFDVRHLAQNAQMGQNGTNQTHALLLSELLLAVIGEWRTIDVLSKYKELVAQYKADVNTSSDSKDSPNWLSMCNTLIQRLLRSKDAEPFRRPVQYEDAPDYHIIVSNPMDLGSIWTKLQSDEYKSAEQFAQDVRLVFSNSRKYNTNKKSRIYSMTVRLSALFEELWPGVIGRRRKPRPDYAEMSGVKVEPSTSNGRVHVRTKKGKGIGKRSIRQRSEQITPDSIEEYAQGVDTLASADASERLSPSSGLGTAEPNNNPTDSEDDAPLRSSNMHRYSNSNGVAGGSNSNSNSNSNGHSHRSSNRKRLRNSSNSSEEWNKRPLIRKRISSRERSSSECSSGDMSEGIVSVCRYSTDRSYKPMYSSDDDRPLTLIRQEQQDGGETSSRQTNNRRKKQRVRLRDRQTSLRYNEDSEEDSIAAISKRIRSVQGNNRRIQLQASSSNLVTSEHDYASGNRADNDRFEGESSGWNNMSVSSRGRVRKITAKARGLFGN